MSKHCEAPASQHQDYSLQQTYSAQLIEHNTGIQRQATDEISTNWTEVVSDPTLADCNSGDVAGE